MFGHEQHLLSGGEPRVEAPRDVAHQLQMLALVLSHRHLLRAVGEHVRGLQHGVEQQPGRHELALPDRLVAKLVHPLQPPELGDAAQQPRQLGVLGHVALAKQRGALRVDPGRQQYRRRVVAALAQLGRLVGDGGRVQVDYAEDPLAALLAGDVLGDRTDVVAEVLAPGRLDSGEDAHVRSSPASAGAASCR